MFFFFFFFFGFFFFFLSKFLLFYSVSQQNPDSYSTMRSGFYWDTLYCIFYIIMRESPKTNNNKIFIYSKGESPKTNNNKIFIYSKGESPKTNNNNNNNNNNNKILLLLLLVLGLSRIPPSRSFCRPEIDLGRGGVHPNDCWGMGCVVG